MTDKNGNKKLPNDPIDQGVTPTYPWDPVEMDVNGAYVRKYSNPDDASNAFVEKMDHDGSYEITQASGLKSKLSGDVREYVTGGSSHAVDGHVDTSTGGSVSHVVEGEHGVQSKGSMYVATGGAHVVAAAEGTVQHDVGSAANHLKSASGIASEVYDDNHFSYVGKDKQEVIVGTQVVIIQSGENALHVQAGNMDTRVENGKYQVYSGGDMNIICGGTLTIKNSQGVSITISGTNISVNAPSSVSINASSASVSAQNITLSGSTSIALNTPSLQFG